MLAGKEGGGRRSFLYRRKKRAPRGGKGEGRAQASVKCRSSAAQERQKNWRVMCGGGKKGRGGGLLSPPKGGGGKEKQSNLRRKGGTQAPEHRLVGALGGGKGRTLSSSKKKRGGRECLSRKGERRTWYDSKRAGERGKE